MKEIKQETNRPKGNLPYQDVNRPFRMQFVIPGPGIKIEQDKNGVLYISAEGGASVSDIVAGDNIEIERREDGAVVISAVNTITDISAGENVTVSIDPDTGSAVISTIIGGDVNEHYKGVFENTEELIAKDPEPEEGDYGLIKTVFFTNGAVEWTGSYKYCFFFDGAWKLVDQMLTFTKNLNLIYKYFSVGGGSPTIYLHEVAKSGNFWDLNNIPIVATPEVTVEGTTVTATCATEGAEIWYTTDGSMPHVNGTKYTGPITVSEATSFRFVGIKNGMINSLEATASADYELQAPVIELDWQTGVVTMTNPNVDGQGNPVGNIYYSRDDSPVQLYTEPLQEMAAYGLGVHYVAYVSEGNEQSALTDVVFPRADIEGYGDSASETGVISFFWSCSGGEVHYTLDGSTPNFNSPMMNERLYTNRYGSVVNFKCCSFRDGYIPRGVRTKTYGYSSPSAPSVSYNSETGLVTLLRAGNVMTSPEIPLKTTPDDPTIGCRIYYTLDGSTPTDQSTLYTGPFQVSGNVTVKAVLLAYGQYYSDVATENITVLAPPQISFGLNVPTTFDGLVTLINPNNDGEIRYTTDGSTPTAESQLYSSVIHLSQTKTVKAVVVAGGAVSAVAEQTFTQLPAAQCGMSTRANTGQQTISVQPQSYNGSSVDHWINLVSDGLEVFPYIQLDESFSQSEMCKFAPAWSCYIWSVLDGYIPKCVPWGDGGQTPDSPVIHYREETSDILFERGVNTSTIPLQTNNNTPELGCRVYYTLDGSTPDDKSTLWDGKTVSVAPGTTVKALVECYGQYESEVATYNVPGGMEYMYLEAAQSNSTVSMISTLETAPDLEYSTDGVTWQEWQHTTADGTHTFDTITLGAVGDKVYFRGDNPNGIAFFPEGAEMPNISNFVLTGAINGGGNVMSLLDKTMVLTEVPQFGFFGLFIFEDEDLEPALLTPPSMDTITAIGKGGCISMYGRCTSLTSAADMPSLTAIGDEGCEGMYDSCTSITSAADMPLLTTIGDDGCKGMYSTCISLTSAADMPSLTTIGDNGCLGMYIACTAIITAANMPSLITIGNNGCGLIYKACTFDMSNDGSTLNFDFPTPPVTAGNTTYATAHDVATWMGNTNGF